jgi:hypothetical protein
VLFAHTDDVFIKIKKLKNIKNFFILWLRFLIIRLIYAFNYIMQEKSEFDVLREKSIKE